MALLVSRELGPALTEGLKRADIGFGVVVDDPLAEPVCFYAAHALDEYIKRSAIAGITSGMIYARPWLSDELGDLNPCNAGHAMVRVAVNGQQHIIDPSYRQFIFCADVNELPDQKILTFPEDDYAIVSRGITDYIRRKRPPLEDYEKNPCNWLAHETDARIAAILEAIWNPDNAIAYEARDREAAKVEKVLAAMPSGLVTVG